jgi:hypothetical protein
VGEGRWGWLRRPDGLSTGRDVATERLRLARAMIAAFAVSAVAAQFWAGANGPVSGSGPDLFALLDRYSSVSGGLALSAIAAVYGAWLATLAVWTLAEWRIGGRLPKRRISGRERVVNGVLGGGSALIGGLAMRVVPSTDGVDPEALTFTFDPAPVAAALVLSLALITLAWLVLLGGLEASRRSRMGSDGPRVA